MGYHVKQFLLLIMVMELIQFDSSRSNISSPYDANCSTKRAFDAWQLLAFSPFYIFHFRHVEENNWVQVLMFELWEIKIRLTRVENIQNMINFMEIWCVFQMKLIFLLYMLQHQVSLYKHKMYIYWYTDSLIMHGLTQAHLFACPKPGPAPQMSYVLIFFYVNGRSEGERLLFILLILVELFTIII